MASVAQAQQFRDGKDPLLELIIQKYTQASRDSIRGPVAVKADLHFFARNSLSFQLADQKKPDFFDEHQAGQTSFDGYRVASFNVGGEKRLCFTQLVQVVLKDCHVQEIFKRRDELLIFCSKCSPQQLDALKLAGVLPWTTTSSNLISKSDAYRLCASLYGPRAVQGHPRKRSPQSFEVYHECFGGCIGVFDPELYYDANAACIRCTDCKGLFSTRKFVAHNHLAYDEVRTCHWGFDSSRWPSYLMLVEQKPNSDLMNLWASIKAKFDGNRFKQKPAVTDLSHDSDFVSYIRSPEQKKSLVSPIECLRRRESISLTGESSRNIEYFDNRSEEQEARDSKSSALYAWLSSSNPSAAGTCYSDDTHFRSPDSRPSLSKVTHHSSNMHSRPLSSCGCGSRWPSSSSLYLDCLQCKSASHVQSCSGLHMLAQKASELPVERDVKPGVESMISTTKCSCDQCKDHQTDSLSSCIEEVLRRFTRDVKITTAVSDLVNALCSEMRRIGISQEDRIHELTVGSQRLQTEIYWMKTEYETKLSEALESKTHLEQELEIVQRDRQKDFSRYNHLKWEVKQETEKQKVNADERTDIQKEALLSEIRLLKIRLDQSMIDRENLTKQLSWQPSRAPRRHEPASRIDVDKWTPCPSMGNTFSDSDCDSEIDEQNMKQHWRTPVVNHTSHRPALVSSSSNVNVPETLPGGMSARSLPDAETEWRLPMIAPWAWSSAVASHSNKPYPSHALSKRKLATVDGNDNRFELEDEDGLEVEE